MVSINDALKNGGPTFWAGSKLTRDSETNTASSGTAVEITIPTGATSLVVSSRGSFDYNVWVVPQGTASITKSSASGAQTVNGSGQGRWEGLLDPEDQPRIYIGAIGSDDTFDLIFQ